MSDLMSSHFLFNKVKDLAVANYKKRGARSSPTVFPVDASFVAYLKDISDKATNCAYYDLEKNTFYPSINELYINNEGKIEQRLPKSAYLSFSIDGERVEAFIFSEPREVGYVVADSLDKVKSLFGSLHDANQHTVPNSGEGS